MLLDFPNQNTVVHTWKYDLNAFELDVVNIQKSLSVEETERANRFFNPRDKKRYLLVHYFLRDVLSKYQKNISKETIEFYKGIHLKPYLQQQQDEQPLYFNLSYREDYAIVAISNSDVLGVDVEKIKPLENIKNFITTFFSIEEQQLILQQPTEQERLAILFRFWTIKESIIKALGVGFELPLINYNVSEFIKNTSAYPHFNSTDKWYICPIEMNDTYKASFAVKTNTLNYSIFNYE